MSASPTNANLELNRDLAALRAAPVVARGGPADTKGHEALQALLAFSSLHEQIRNKRTLAEGSVASDHAVQLEQFALDEVLQLVAERAQVLTEADGVAIALAEGNAIICRASTGEIAPDTKAKLNPNSGFSGACFRTGKIVRCDDAENDPRVNVQAAQRLGVRSMVAVPLAGRRGTIGLLEAFSSEAHGFNDRDIRSLNLLSELVIAAMKPEEESRMAEVSQLVTSQADEAAAHANPVVDAEPPQSEIPVSPVEHETKSGAIEQFSFARLPNFESKGRSWSGLKVVFGLMLLAIALGAGLWWKLRAAPRGNVALNPAPAAPVETEQGPGQVLASSVSNQLLAQNRVDGLTPVTGVRHWSSPGSSTVVIDLQDQVQYEQHRLTDPERIYFDLHDTALAPGLFGKTMEVGDTLLVRVRVAQPVSGVTRVVLETKNSPNFSVSLEQNPYRLVVQIRSVDSPAQPRAKLDLFGPADPTVVEQPAVSQPHIAVVPSPAQSLRAESRRVTPPPQVSKFRIVLDAGHGGWDEGTIGRKGLMEKDLALDIVARLGKLIAEQQGADVIYTRRDDTYVPLEKRAEIANLSQADLFVSIHANYSDFPSARGVETYYTNTYSSLNARMPEANATAQNVNWANVDIREKALQSQRLAASVQKALCGKLATENPGLRDRGIKKASYVVLTGTTMPAILAEVSFVSSPTDEKSLKSAAYRQRIAQALYRGIIRYTADVHRVTMASASGKPSGR